MSEVNKDWFVLANLSPEDKVKMLKEGYQRLLRDVLEFYAQPGTLSHEMYSQLLAELDEI